MLQLTPQSRVFLAVAPADFRRGIDGLAALCRQRLGENPMEGAVFVFRNRRGTSLKLLCYDGQGFWLCQKRLSQGRLSWWPSITVRTAGSHQYAMECVRDRIEHLYQSKDEQLKTILELVNTKLQLSQSTPINAVREQIENSVDADLEESAPPEISKQTKREGNIQLQKLSLRKYLKNTELGADEKRIIKRRFASAYGSDIRVLHHNGEFYLDLSKFDYSDLLKI